MARRSPEIIFPKLHTAQRELYRGMTRREVWRCGRRFGKTTLLEIISGDEAIRYPGIGPESPFDRLAARAASEGKKVGWFSPSYKLNAPTFERIRKMIRPLMTHSNKTEGLIDTDSGGQIEFWTLENPDAGRSRSYDLAIVDEGSLIKKGLKQIWQQSIEPTLLDRRGSAIMAGTPKGIDPDNFFYEACNDKRAMSDGGLGWTERHMPTWANPTLDPVGVANLVNEYPPLVYQQEFCAEFVNWQGAAFFDLQKCFVNGLPVEYPASCDGVFAVIDSATKTGKEHDGTAVAYFAIDRIAMQTGGWPLTLLDWDIVQIEGAVLETWLPSVFLKLDELARMTGARRGVLGTWIEDKASGMILLQQAANRGWPAHAIDSKLTSVGKDERAISVSGYVYRELFKVSRIAYDRVVTFKQQARNHFLTQFFDYRVGQKDGADDLLDSVCYGIAIALGNSEGY